MAPSRFLRATEWGSCSLLCDTFNGGNWTERSLIDS